MKIVLAPDSFKGSMSAALACAAMAEGVRRVFPDAEIITIPMADGGEGTAESLVNATGGKLLRLKVMGPLASRESVEAAYGILGDGVTAVIEMAQASGLVLVPESERDVLAATTYGTGQLIAHALNEGCREFILAIGGSATNDGGVGMAQALGYRFLDAAGDEVPFGGGALGKIVRIDPDGRDVRLAECRFTVACDVDNPLCGPNGASAIFSPQKGATPGMVHKLDENLRHLASLMEFHLGVEVLELPGAGAAGGLGAGSVAFLGATLKRGVDIVLDAVNFSPRAANCDVILTGEGCCDAQSVRGKVVYGVARAAALVGARPELGKPPVIAIAGSIGVGAEALFNHGLTSLFSMVDGPMTLEEAMRDAPRLLANATERVMRCAGVLRV